MIDIQNHARWVEECIYDKVDDAYVEIDSRTFLQKIVGGCGQRTFLCSNLLRDQVEGLFEYLDNGQLGKLGFTRKDFSQTGAARTIALDVTKFFRQGVLSGLMEIPDIYQSMFDR